MAIRAVPAPELMTSAAEVTQFVRAAKHLAIDTEATGKQAYVDHLTAWSMATPERRVGCTRYALEGLRQGLTDNPDIRIVCHFLMFDAPLLRRAGVDLFALLRPDQIHDSIIKDNLLDPNSAHDLKYRANDYLGIQYQKYMTYGFTADDLGDETAGKPMSARFLDYITLDAWSTVMIDRYLDERLAAIARPSSLPIWGQAAPQLLDYYRLIEQPLTPVLLAMSWRGVRIDAAQLQSAAPAMDARVNDLHAKICRLVGHPLNVNSHPQVYKLLYQELRYPEPKIRSRKTGLTKVNDEALKLLVKEACPRPGLETLPLDILEYRKWTHMKSTYITGLLARLLAGRLHSTFGQSGTATGRLNSTNPNLQNIPIRTPEGRQIRAAFIPSTGHAFIDADYAQIELRMHAWISQARTVLDPILAGQDLHCDTAAAISAAAGLVPPATYDEVWAMTQTAKREFTERQRTLSLLRTVSKPINFGVIYGVTAPTLQTNLRTDAGIDLPEAQCEEFLETYFRRHPDVLAHNQRTLRDAGAYGFVASILGRKRAVFRVTGKRPDKHMVNAAYNTPIQASAQEIIKLKMIEYGNDPEFRKLGLHLLIQVHDELLMECPRENAEAAKAYIAATMPTVSFPLGVPMAADVHIGDDWEEAH